MTRRGRIAVVFASVVIGVAASARGQTIWYVDDDATGGGSGSTWEDAYVELQAALALAVAGDEVRVAQGSYWPDYDVDLALHDGNRESTFRMVNGVQIYGGYAGLAEDEPDARSITEYETVLTGDLGGDDLPGFVNNEENSYHVVTGSDADADALLDGFTITAGNANGVAPHDYGGGMYNVTGSPTVANCTFKDNSAYEAGGGVFNWVNANPRLTNCDFDGNHSFYGGGMHNYDSSPIVSRCTFVNNAAYMSGGAIDNADGSNAIIFNCSITQNSADNGGGICNWWNSNSTITNSVLTQNSASDYGGGMFSYYSSPKLFNCAMSGNIAGGGGGALALNDSSAAVTNCIVWDNIPDGIFGMSATVRYSNVQDGFDCPSCEGNMDADPLFVRKFGPGLDEEWGTEDDDKGDLHLLAGSPCIDAGDNLAFLNLAVGLGGLTASGDLDCRARFIDDPATTNVASASLALIDMGAYEFQMFRPADLNQDDVVDAEDLAQLLASWGP